jgi:predicted DNA-binding transcriptional regulator AlpA
MDADTRLLLIHLTEGFLEGLRNNTIQFTEEDGRRLVTVAKEILHPEYRVPERVCSIYEACEYLGITRPTFNKYIEDGHIPQGLKHPSYRVKVWDKNDIESFKQSEFYRCRKRRKD